MVFQQFNLFEKTALENVMEGLIVVKKMKKTRPDHCIRRTETGRHGEMGKPLSETYVGGQQQKWRSQEPSP